MSDLIENRKDRKTHFYTSITKIGLIGFGGGSALIPVIEKEIVEENRLVTKEKYDQDVAIACVTPGALPVEIAAGLGKRIGGLHGMVAAALLMAFPGAFFTVLILSALAESSKMVLAQIEYLAIGIVAFISALIMIYVKNMLENAAKQGKGALIRNGIIMMVVFLLNSGSNLRDVVGIPKNPMFALSTVQILCIAFFILLFTRGYFSRLNVIISAAVSLLYIGCYAKRNLITSKTIRYAIIVLMIVLSIYGLAKDIYTQMRSKEAGAISKRIRIAMKKMSKELVVWILFILAAAIPAVLISDQGLSYIVNGCVSTFLSYGGGDAYLSVADGMFVHTGMVEITEFYGKLVPIANALPGSILCKILAGVGYLMGHGAGGSQIKGYIMALCGLAISVSASGMVFCLMKWFYLSFEKGGILSVVREWIQPIICGLLLNVTLSMINSNLAAAADSDLTPMFIRMITLAVIVVDLFLLTKKKAGNLRLILLSGMIGLVSCNLYNMLV